MNTRLHEGAALLELEEELKKFVISTLALEDLDPETLPADKPLFGEGLGLDSIDALELGMALQKRYKIKLDANSEKTKAHFYSVRSLAKLVSEYGTSQDKAA